MIPVRPCEQEHPCEHKACKHWQTEPNVAFYCCRFELAYVSSLVEAPSQSVATQNKENRH